MDWTVDDGDDVEMRIIVKRIVTRRVRWVIRDASQCKVNLFFILRRGQKVGGRERATADHVWDQFGLQPFHQVMNCHGWAHGGVGLGTQSHLVVVIFHDRFVGRLESLFQFEEGDVECGFVRFEEFRVEGRPVGYTRLIMLKPLVGGTNEK